MQLLTLSKLVVQSRPKLFDKLQHKSEGDRSSWEYPFAVAGVNLTFALQEVLDLRKPQLGGVGHVPTTDSGRAFLELLGTDPEAFEEVIAREAH